MPFPVVKNLSFLTRHLVRRNALAQLRTGALIKRERLPAEQLSARQERLLHATLISARKLPRYAHIAEAPANTPASDWLHSAYPVISKADLVTGRSSFYPNNGKRRPWWASGKTSGTTGTPLEVFRSIDSVIWEEAFHLQYWHWAGYRNGDAQAILRGDQILDIRQEHPPFWIWDRFGRQLLVSTRHLSPATAKAMLDSIARSGATQLRAYPSSGFDLARAAQKLAHPLRLRAVVTGSEPIYQTQREQIEHSFGCKVFDFYGMAERIAFAGQCEHGHYHLHPEYSYVEILDQHDQPTNDFGYVVGTTLHNHVMPLIRYRIADRARWVHGACPCGRHYPRIELSSGKVEDQLYDLDGNTVSASIITFALKGATNIKKTQVAQVGPGQWVIRIVPDLGYRPENEQQLLQDIKKYVSSKVQVHIVRVDDLSLQPSGKFKWIVQEWPGAKALMEAL